MGPPLDACWDTIPPPSPPPPPRIRVDRSPAPHPLFFVHRNHHTRVSWPPGRGPGPPRAFSTTVELVDEDEEEITFEFSGTRTERNTTRHVRREYVDTMQWEHIYGMRRSIYNAGRRDKQEADAMAADGEAADDGAVEASVPRISAHDKPLYVLWEELRGNATGAGLDHTARHILLTRMFFHAQWEMQRHPLSPRRLHVLGTRINRALGWISREKYVDLKLLDDGDYIMEMKWRYRYMVVIGVLCVGTVPEGLEALRYYFLNTVKDQVTLYSTMHLLAINAALRICLSQQFVTSGLEVALDVWENIEDHVLRASRNMPGSAVAAGNKLRSTLVSIVERLVLSGSAMAWLKRIYEVDPVDRFLNAAKLLIISLAELHVSEKGLEVMNFAQSVDVEVPMHIKLVLMHALVVDDNFGFARMVFNSIPDAHERPEALQEALYMFSHQGERTLANEYVERLKRFGPLAYNHKFSHLRSVAFIGDTTRALELFSKYYEHVTDEHTLAQYPRSHRYWMHKFWEMLITAYYNDSQPEQAEKCVQRMLRDGYPYDQDLFNLRIRYYARIGDSKTVARLWQHAKTVDNLSFSSITYLQLMVLCARQGDADGAAAIMAQARSRGISPTRHMVATLMNAYAEARQWRKVVSIFKDLGHGETAVLRRTIEIFNIVLKAYVQMGAPYKMVQRFFEKMVSVEHVHPNQITYALLTQSAAETRHYVQARKMYEQMHSVAKMPTVRDYRAMPMGVMLVSLLPGNARDLYHEMRLEGIELQPDTYAAILRLAARRSWSEKNPPRRLLNQILNNSSIARLTGVERETALQKLYAPVMKMYSQQGDIVNLQQLHEDMLHRGGTPSIVTLWLMMDGYRVVGNLDKVHELWDQIFKLAIESRDISPLMPGTVERETGSNLLCVPLSTYIHALSAAGLHDEISRVWREVRDERFLFDANNWTVLCIALIQAGKLDRAYEILERVLIPAQEQLQTATLSLGNSDPSKGSMELGFAPADARKRLSMARFYQSYLSRQRRHDVLKKMHQTRDMLSPLIVLGEISPLWNSWYPHRSLLRLLFEKTRQVLFSKTYMRRLSRTATPDILTELQRLRNSIMRDYPKAKELIDTAGKAEHKHWLQKKRALERPRWRDYRKWLVWTWLAKRVRYRLPRDKTTRKMKEFINRELYMSKVRRRVPWVGYRAWLSRWQKSWRSVLSRRERVWKERGRPLEHSVQRQAHRWPREDDSQNLSSKPSSKDKKKKTKEWWARQARRQNHPPPARQAPALPDWRFKRDKRKKIPKQTSRTVFWS